MHQNHSVKDEKDLFWVDFSSEEEVRDMISMFRNEYKPPLTLWIEKSFYINATNENE